jgi:pyruvate dehydrogenase E2 component (dihydrolipoamide acetyltransferase)
MSVLGDDGTGGAKPEFIDVAGRRIRHLIQPGPRDAVILVHGIGGSLGVWVLNQAALAAGGRTVAAIDLPGHGESTKDLASGSLEELSSTVLDYMDAIGVEDAHLVGHSMGSAVCLDVARRKRERVISLALVSPAGLGSAPDLAWAGRLVKARTAAELMAVLKVSVADERLITPPIVEDVLRYKSLDGTTEAQAQILSTVYRGGDVDASLRRVVDQVPTLVIWGGRDVVIPPLVPAAFDGTTVEYHLLPQYGHQLPVEAAAEVNRLVDEFLGS